jgi:RNA polymerase sigma-70 factor (sigma-E family)
VVGVGGDHEDLAGRGRAADAGPQGDCGPAGQEPDRQEADWQVVPRQRDAAAVWVGLRAAIAVETIGTGADLDPAVRSDLLARVPSGGPGRDSGGQRDAEFREYVATRGRALLRSAYLLTGNLADAEDLVQSALAKTYQAWARIEDLGALDGYVRRAMVNTHISWWRKRRLEEFPTDEIPDRPVADHAGDSDLHDSLRRAIDRLPQRMRAAVLLRYFEDMTEAEVADVLGVSQGTVKSTVSRAVAKLRGDAGLLPE